MDIDVVRLPCVADPSGASDLVVLEQTGGPLGRGRDQGGGVDLGAGIAVARGRRGGVKD